MEKENKKDQSLRVLVSGVVFYFILSVVFIIIEYIDTIIHTGIYHSILYFNDELCIFINTCHILLLIICSILQKSVKSKKVYIFTVFCFETLIILLNIFFIDPKLNMLFMITSNIFSIPVCYYTSNGGKGKNIKITILVGFFAIIVNIVRGHQLIRVLDVMQPFCIMPYIMSKVNIEKKRKTATSYLEKYKQQIRNGGKKDV